MNRTRKILLGSLIVASLIAGVIWSGLTTSGSAHAASSTSITRPCWYSICKDGPHGKGKGDFKFNKDSFKFNK
jgi:hypothetical protein